ncbi:MAG TPA: hypothetical protein VGM67_16255 [Gemmatimonadaceae bacterium]
MTATLASCIGSRRIAVRPSTPASCPPVTVDPRWNEPHFIKAIPGGELDGYNSPPPLPASFDPSTLQGEYDLTLVVTAGVESSDTVRYGRLWLLPIDNAHRSAECTGFIGGCRNVHYAHPLYGFLDSAFRFPEVDADITPLDSRSPDAPGVSVSYDSVSHQLSLDMGLGYASAADDGVGFEVFHADASGFVGRWVDGGLVIFPGHHGVLERLQGHFCAQRRGSSL